MMTMGEEMISHGGEGSLKLRKYLVYSEAFGLLISTMAKRAMRPNVKSDLLGFISLNAMGNYEYRSGEVSQ